MDNVDRLDLAKDMLCQEIMEATSAFDLAKRLWDTGNVECHNHRLSEISGMMPVLSVCLLITIRFRWQFPKILFYKER